MSQRRQWITLDSAIYDYINRAELSQSKYFKLFHLAFTLMEELGIDFFYQVKSVKLPINANKTITLPADFIHYNKFGVLNGAGEVIPLKYNEKLTTFADLQPNRIAQVNQSEIADVYSFSSPVFFNYWNGDSCDNFYGIAGDYSYGGGFKIDNHNGVILLGSDFLWDNCILEYTASPTEGSEYYIPVEFRETMICWLAWQDIANMPSSRKGNLGDKQIRRHDYFEALRRGKARFRPFYLDQAYIQNLETSRLTVKA